MSDVNWSSLDFGPLTKEEISKWIPDKEWQELRKELHGLPLEERFTKLKAFLNSNNNSRRAQVVVTNYINALKRGGMIGKEK